MRVKKVPESPEKVFAIENLKGVDMISGYENPSYNHGAVCLNMSPCGETLHKRNGWREIKKFKDENSLPMQINGIHKYVISDGEFFFIIHAKDKFYKCPPDFSSASEINIISGTVKDMKTSSFQKGKNLFIIGCGGILVFDGGKIFDVYSSDLCYIPTTSVNICDYRFKKSGDTFEDSNILTKRRKNTMVGKQFSYNISSEPDSTEYIMHPEFFTDAPCDKNSDKGIQITISITVGGENDVYSAKTKDGYKYSGEVTVSFSILKSDIPTENSQNIYKSASSVLGIKNQNLTLFKNSTQIVPRVTFGSNLNSFAFDFNMDKGEENNIIFEFDADSSVYESTIKNCMFGTDFETDGATSHLILAGNKEKGNECYFSDISSDNELLYFPRGNIISAGDRRYSICGFSKLSNGQIAVLKQNSFTVISFSLKDKKTLYKSNTCYTPLICAGNRTCKNVNSDALFFGKNGVFAIDASLEKVLQRSGNLSFEGFSEDDFNSSFACENNGRYFLFISGKIFMCDARYTFYRNNRLDSSFEYEWWIWDNCPATCAQSFDGQLYMGKSNGAIAIFDSDYCDKSLISSEDGDVLYDYENQQFQINTYFDIKNGDPVFISDHLLLLSENVEYIKSLSKVILPEDDFFSLQGDEKHIKIFDGEKIKIKSGGTISEEAFTIASTNSIERSFEIYAPNTVLPDTVEAVYLCENSCREYKIKENGNSWEFFYNDSHAKILAEEIKITKLKKENVTCEFITPFLNFDCPFNAKSLVEICVTPGLNCGKTDFGFKTKNNIFISKIYQPSALDFEKLNFKNFSLCCDFAKSVIIRTREPCFNYITFRFFSDSDSDCSIKGIYATYKINSNTAKGMI